MRGRSGNGTWVAAPYNSLLATNRLLMSCEPVVYWCTEPSRFRNMPLHSAAE